MYTGIHIKYSLFLSDFSKAYIFSRDFEKLSHMKFHENSSSGSLVVSCGRTDGQTDMTKLTVAFRNSANAR